MRIIITVVNICVGYVTVALGLFGPMVVIVKLAQDNGFQPVNVNVNVYSALSHSSSNALMGSAEPKGSTTATGGFRRC